jgi:hypothetical protein
VVKIHWIWNTYLILLSDKYCHVLGVCYYRQAMDWILDLLRPLGTTSNYIATANLHYSRFTTAPATHFSACCVFTNLSLVTASNSGNLELRAFTSFLHRLSFGMVWQPFRLGTQLILLIKFRHELHRKHRFFLYLQNCLTVACVFAVAGTCLTSRRLAVDVSSGSTIPTFRRHSTIFSELRSKWAQASIYVFIVFFAIIVKI